MSVDAIPRRALHDELADRLRRMIVECELAPGAKISEPALCARFGVSRTPLREALKVLATEGLVELTPRHGASVAPVTLEDLAEVFPVMGALEGLAGELACARITDAEIAKIRALHGALKRHFAAGDLPAYFAVNEAIHEAILAAAANPTLAAVRRGLAGRIRRARYMANISPERWAEAVREHDAIIDALERRDGETLGRILRTHLSEKLRSLVETGLRTALDGQVEARGGRA